MWQKLHTRNRRVRIQQLLWWCIQSADVFAFYRSLEPVLPGSLSRLWCRPWQLSLSVYSSGFWPWPRPWLWSRLSMLLGSSSGFWPWLRSQLSPLPSFPIPGFWPWSSSGLQLQLPLLHQSGISRFITSSISFRFVWTSTRIITSWRYSTFFPLLLFKKGVLYSVIMMNHSQGIDSSKLR